MFPIQRRRRDGSCLFDTDFAKPGVPKRDGSGRGAGANRGRGCSKASNNRKGKNRK